MCTWLDVEGESFSFLKAISPWVAKIHQNGGDLA